MKLNKDYLVKRYDYWKEEIGAHGIWDPSLFKEIQIQIRPKCRRYNGIFSRKRVIKEGKISKLDRIIIYNNVDDFDSVFLDSILVHEMIHQYFCQNDIKDTSSHGRLFKSFMKRINEAFPDQLKINLKSRNPSLPVKGPGLTIHNLILSWDYKDCYCCLIHPKRLKEFDRMLKRLKKSGQIRGYTWAQSVDVYFNQYTRCMRSLHGIKKTIPEMKIFCKEYNVVEIGEKWLTLRKA